MKNNTNFKAIALVGLGLALLLGSCKKERDVLPTIAPEVAVTKGTYILCEGLWGVSTSAISYYDTQTRTVEQDIYKSVNKAELGEMANDLKAYGSKMYCVVSGNQGEAKSFVDVMDLATCRSLKRISFNSGNVGAMPRYITFYKNKAYVSRYDGKISRIDTATLAVDGELQLMNGANPAEGLEELAVANGKLYVTNSSHPYYQKGLKTKVTVIDLGSFAKTKDIEVGNNPVHIAAAGNGDLYTVTWNDYVVFNAPTLVRISSVTDAVLQTENHDLGTVQINNNQAWVTQDVYSSPTVRAINLATGKLGNALVTDGTSIHTPNGLTVNPFDQSVVVSSSAGSVGMAMVYGIDGKQKYSFVTAGGPKCAVFSYTYR